MAHPPGKALPVKEVRGSKRHQDKSTRALNFRADMSEEDKIRLIERYARDQLATFLEQEQDHRASGSQDAGWGLLGMIERATETAGRLAGTGVRAMKTAAVCALVAMLAGLVCLYVYANRTVGTLVDSVGAKWDVDVNDGADLKIRRMTLQEGYAQIRLRKGTDVIVQAPTTFKLETANRMSVEGGWITAKVPPEATGFTVQTPASRVVDFGTEFGLLVGVGSSAEVHVFDGKIGLSQGLRPKARTAQQQLTEGEAVSVDRAGRIERGLVEDQTRLFVRAMPRNHSFGIPGKRLDLADMVGGGNGLDTGVLGQGIDPTTGEVTPTRKVIDGPGRGYKTVPSLLFIDGVFVPNGGEGPVTVASTGLTFDGFPQTTGKCYEGIINGAIFHTRPFDPHPGALAGRTYNTRQWPSIGMHTNLGITFDLDKIRSSLPGAKVVRFRALCGVSETVVQYYNEHLNPKAAVEFWVLVDGQARYAKELAVMPSQPERVDVSLDPEDRFLTLATTSAMGYSFSWGMIAEAELELALRTESPVEESTSR
jgi:ferric-dicitrate binding protein FerR (iron transport regulator)